MSFAETLQLQLDKAEAAIQSEVAEFLGLKSRIIPYRSSPDASVRQTADMLFTRQVSLEGELQSAMGTIEEIKQGYAQQGAGYLIAQAGTIKEMYDTAKDIKAHKEEVKQFVGNGPAMAGAVSFGNNALMLGLGLGAIGLVYLIKKR